MSDGGTREKGEEVGEEVGRVWDFNMSVLVSVQT